MHASIDTTFPLVAAAAFFVAAAAGDFFAAAGFLALAADAFLAGEVLAFLPAADERVVLAIVACARYYLVAFGFVLLL